MKLHFLNRAPGSDQSVSVTHNLYPNFLKVWHYHSELELALIIRSTGTRFIGDSIAKFQEGELVLLGENLPHMWLNDPEYFEKDSILEAEAVVIHFNRDFLGNGFLDRPEMLGLEELFDRAGRGIHFNQPSNRIIDAIQDLKDQRPFDRVVTVLKILEELNRETELEYLTSPGYLKNFKIRSDQQRNRIYSYVMKNFNQPISSKDVAAELGMNPSAFSRYFTKVHRKSFTRYLNEVRIGYACKRLAEGNSTVAEICYESGFNNISNFNRQFRSLKAMSPKEFEKLYTINR